MLGSPARMTGCQGSSLKSCNDAPPMCSHSAILVPTKLFCLLCIPNTSFGS